MRTGPRKGEMVNVTSNARLLSRPEYDNQKFPNDVL